jgi:ribulose-phosphate 3-epimerase
MTLSLPRPPADWLDTLPRDRLLGELSLWSADLGRLTDDMARVEDRADLYHVDVADGHFSPALLFFPDLLRCARRHTRKPVHVHLMVADAVLHAQIEQFAEVGADAISVHAEHADVPAALDLIERLGCVPGLVLQRHTPVEAAQPFLDRIRLLTLLGTRIGVKGQGLDDGADGRMQEARALLDRQALDRRVLLVADGGIRAHTVPGLRRAGADAVVMGSLAFGAADYGARMDWLHGLGRGEG